MSASSPQYPPHPSPARAGRGAAVRPAAKVGAAIASPCVCTRVRQAARMLTQLYDAALTPAGLTVAQYALLRTIARLGEPHISALATATGLDRSTLGRNLRLLAVAGYVRLDAGADRRTRLVRMTAAGEVALARAQPYWQRVQAEVAAGLGAAARDRLYDLLARIDELAARLVAQPSSREPAS